MGEPVTTATRWRQIEAVLDRALDAPPDAWDAVVAEACGDDAALRDEVRELLAAYGRHEQVLADDAGALAAELLRDVDDGRRADALVGARLGAWRVVRQVGQGGMARVFLGERADDAFAQRVAIKVLRAGLDTPADVARFDAERRILASLDHPHIARLLDSGVAPDGRPYLVLEYVEGEPLTTWCDARRLDVPARLRLFLQVAEAIEAAHRQLVVHRDLKPSNVLVDAEGRPRLLDFGIARILDPSRDEGAEPTRTRRRWLSPDYAAPEQFAGAAPTTATDVYQLGAVLYELLSGVRPYAHVTGGWDALEAAVRRDDPAPPSRRAAHVDALGRDLDAIVLRAMRRAPEARYPSVAALAADVRRALGGEPVLARAGERAYRWRRLARRHAVALAVGAAAVLAAAGSLAALTAQNRRIARALAAATAERERSQRMTGFVLGLFDGEGAPVAGDTLSARALLARGEARADALGGQPALQAALLDAIGRARVDLGALDAARPTLERALALRRRLHGDAHPDVARTRANLAVLDERAGRFDEAERGYREALARLRATLGDSAEATQRTLLDLGSALHAAGRHRDAAAAFAEWERVAGRRPPRRDARGARQLQLLGEYVGSAVDVDRATLRRAEGYLREALAIQVELHGPRHPDVAAVQTALAHTVAQQGRHPAADSLYAAARATLRATYPGGHRALAEALYLQGASYSARGRHADGVPLLREASAMLGRFVDASHPELGAYRTAYGDALRGAGDAAAAVPVLRDAEARLRARVGADNIMTVRARIALGDALRLTGRLAEAEAQLGPTAARLRATRGVASRHTQRALRALAAVYDAQRRPADAARTRALLAAPAVPPR